MSLTKSMKLVAIGALCLAKLATATATVGMNDALSDIQENANLVEQNVGTALDDIVETEEEDSQLDYSVGEGRKLLDDILDDALTLEEDDDEEDEDGEDGELDDDHRQLSGRRRGRGRRSRRGTRRRGRRGGRRSRRGRRRGRRGGRRNNRRRLSTLENEDALSDLDFVQEDTADLAEQNIDFVEAGEDDDEENDDGHRQLNGSGRGRGRRSRRGGRRSRRGGRRGRRGGRRSRRGGRRSRRGGRRNDRRRLSGDDFEAADIVDEGDE